MLPGFRFLFAATFFCVSILMFGLGAAALLRAAHEEFASKPSWRGAPETTFAQQIDTTRPVLSLLRVEPRPVEPASVERIQVEQKPVDLLASVERKTADLLAPVAAPQTEPAPATPSAAAAPDNPPARDGDKTAALNVSEPEPIAPLAPTQPAQTEPVSAESARTDTALQPPQDVATAEIKPDPKADTQQGEALASAEATPAAAPNAPVGAQAENGGANIAATEIAAASVAPKVSATPPAPFEPANAPSPEASDTPVKIATTGNPSTTSEPQGPETVIRTAASAGADRNAIRKQQLLARRAYERRRLAWRARMARQAALAAQQLQQQQQRQAAFAAQQLQQQQRQAAFASQQQPAASFKPLAPASTITP